MGMFGAVSIEGPKGCGKTWTALKHADSAVYMQNTENDYSTREAAKLNPAAILTSTKPLLVDEWQEATDVWGAVQPPSSGTNEKGQYILTGSVVPKAGSFAHSDAGKIAKIRMRTMSLYESGDSSGAASLSDLFQGKKFEPGASALSQEKLIGLAIRGGWPGNISAAKEDAGMLPEQYIIALAKTGMTDADNVRRNPGLALHLLAAVARTNAEPALMSAIVADVQARFGQVARQTIADYLSVLMRLYTVEEIEPWLPALSGKIRLRKGARRILADPSLAVSVLRAGPAELARDPRALGGIFKSLCLRDLLIYSEALEAKLSHYHDASGLEVDAVIESGAQWAGIEIKMGAHRVEEGAASLKRLRGKLVSNGTPAPAVLCVITDGCPLFARADGVNVIPLDCMGP
jgi:predicted AAA+ superfamily ATPase